MTEHTPRIVPLGYVKENSPGASALNELDRQLHEVKHVQEAAERSRVGPGNPLKREIAIIHWLHKLDSLLVRGPEVEHRMWKSSIEQALIDGSQIPERYWKHQMHQMRDDGINDIERRLNGSKLHRIESIRDAQRESLEPWVNYFEADIDHYPLWFKIYVWDGMTRLATFDRNRGKFRRRDETTTAAYPQLHTPALRSVYETIKDFQIDGNDPERELAELVVSGNFNHLYSHFLAEKLRLVPTPTQPENVYGTWQHYAANDVDVLANASQATPWCISSKTEAKRYLENQDEFYLFHLHDSEGVQSHAASASIRMEYGKVVELSGLDGETSQAIEPALLEQVTQKARELPGGTRLLQALKDKQRLIALDEKMTAGDVLTLEDLRFLYQIDHRIEYIDPLYLLEYDPRVERMKSTSLEQQKKLLRTKYDEITIAFLFHGSNTADGFFYRSSRRPSEWIKQHVPEKIVLNNYDMPALYNDAEALLDSGVAPMLLLNRFEPLDILRQYNVYKERDYPLDVTSLLGQLSLDELMIEKHAMIDGGVSIVEIEIAIQNRTT